MSTYTDLHNILKETLNVDYKTRDTNQEAHFKNERNEYWGTFKGTIAVENATINSSRIVDSFIEGGIIHNAKLSSDDFGVIDLGQIQTELESMSSFVGENDKYLSSAIEDSRIGISGIVEQLEDLSNAISSEVIARGESINVASSYIIEKLGEEANIRQDKDDWLKDQISATSSYTIESIENISNFLSSHYEQNKHFKIDAIDDSDNVLRAKEWTVNTLTSFAVSDGEVEVEDSILNDKIGQIYYSSNLGDEWIKFKVYKTIPSEIAVALDPCTTYTLKLGEVKATKPGYAIVFNKVDGKLNGQLFTESEQYYDIVAKDVVVGTVSNCKPEGGTSDIKSGLVKITAPASLSVFNSRWELNESQKSHEIICDGKNKITYVGDNSFRFDRNITEQIYLKLFNNEYQFGSIYYKNTVVQDRQLISTVVDLNEVGNVSLTEENDFSDDVYLNGKLCNVSCDATTLTASTIEVNELHRQYAYDAYEISPEESNIKVILSSDENTFIENIKTDSIIYLDLSNMDGHRPYKKVYPLSWTSDRKYEYHWHDENPSNFIDLTCDVDSMTIDVAYGYGATTSFKKDITIVNNPAIWNADPYRKIFKSQNLDLTFTNGWSSDLIPKEVFYGKAIYHSAPSFEYNLTVNDKKTSKIFIAIPNKGHKENISRVFDFVFRISSGRYRDVEIVFIDEIGRPIRYFEDRIRKVIVPTGKFTTIRLKEVRNDVFLVIDYNQNNQEAKIQQLREDLDCLSSEVSATSSYIEDKIDLSVLELQNQILSNDADIEELYKRTYGGLAYRGDLSLDVERQPGYADDTLANLFYNNAWEKYQDGRLTPEQIKNIQLRNGFYFIAKSADKAHKYTFEGVEVENADLVIIKEDTLLSAVDASKINIVDVFDADAVHQDELSAVSSALELSVLEISNAISLSVENISFIQDNLSVRIYSLSDEVSGISSLLSSETIRIDKKINDLSNALSIEMSAVSSISNTIDLSVEKLQNQIISNDNDIVYLSNEISCNNYDIEILSSRSSYLDDKISTVSSDLNQLNGRVETLSTDHERRLLSAEDATVVISAFIDEHYKQTLSSIDRKYCNNITTDNLILTDLSGSPTDPHIHQKYYMTFENGTIALKLIK